MKNDSSKMAKILNITKRNEVLSLENENLNDILKNYFFLLNGTSVEWRNSHIHSPFKKNSLENFIKFKGEK